MTEILIYVILILAFVACSIASYFVFKFSWQEECRTAKWTSSDRVVFIALSLFGPVSFGLAIFYCWTVKRHS